MSTPDSSDKHRPARAITLSSVLADRYRIDREIGQGGMATVYLAHDLRHARTVALKVPLPELVLHLGADRFTREIGITTQLQHPNIVPVYDSGAVDGVPFYVMPFVDGETLEQRLTRDGPLPVPEAVEIAAEIADGLAYAHRLGFIHRDVKPGNILLSNGHALLADFGIARAIESADARKLTESGFAVGTAFYMSPEQASASTEVDGRSDVYSLACVLYERLAGGPPFGGASARSVIARHMIDPVPSLRTVRPTVSARLEQVLITALHKLPADRFADAAEFRTALRESMRTGEGSGDWNVAPGADGDAYNRDVTTSTPRARAHRNTPTTPHRNRVALGASLAAVALLAVSVVTWRARAPDADALDANRIMVYPFVVADGFTGSRTVGEDVATLVGNALDGAGPLRWLDGWTLLDAARRDDIRTLSLDEARALARDKRCATFITGRVVMLGDSVRAFLTLHDVAGDSVLAQGEASGGIADLWRSGLNAVTRVLPALIPGGAATTTQEWMNRDPAAIANFLLGESAFRRIHLAEALEHYRAAVARDSTFVMAALRGAQAASWNHRRTEAAALIEVALRHPLAPRYDFFARGYLAYLGGWADSAATLLRAAIADDPEMAVAWMQLGEVYSHLLPLTGNPDSLADLAFLEARRLDSAAANVLLHPIEIRLRRGDLAAAEPLLRRFRADQPDSVLDAKLELSLRCVRDGSARVDWRAAAASSPNPVLFAASAMGGEGTRFGCAPSAFAAVLAVDTANTDAADGRRWVAFLGLHLSLVSRGRYDDAVALVDSTMQRWGFGSTVFLLDSPLIPALADRARLVAQEDERRFGANYQSCPFSRRLWQLGLLEARTGRVAVASAVAGELRRRADSSGSRYEAGLARSVNAFVILATGDTTRALSELSALVQSADVGDSLMWDEAEPRSAERLELATLLLARGDAQRAHDVASVFDSSRPLMHILYLPASLELRMRAATLLGNSDAVQHYRSRLAALRGSGSLPGG